RQAEQLLALGPPDRSSFHPRHRVLLIANPSSVKHRAHRDHRVLLRVLRDLCVDPCLPRIPNPRIPESQIPNPKSRYLYGSILASFGASASSTTVVPRRPRL